MDNKKILVTSGCSFTFEPWNWPTFVAEGINYDLKNVGMASQGNGLISKKLIYAVDTLLNEGKNPDDILVGVMWSGVDRHEFYSENTNQLNNTDGWVENPTSVIPHNDNLYRNWIITNPHWEVANSPTYYRLFHNDISAMILTIQNILLTQWYLEKKGVKYFMTTYTDIFFPKTTNRINEPEVQHWFKMVDRTKFLPIGGCHEWVNENYGKTGGFNSPDNFGFIGIHPTEFGHKKFSEELVIPHIKNNII
jgi:hypothetical protein